MHLASMQIRNYRRFKDATISFESNDVDRKEDTSGTTGTEGSSKPQDETDKTSGVTMLVGSNNSGKTSIVELIQRIFNERSQTVVPFFFSDFNINVRNTWLNGACERIYRNFGGSQTSSNAGATTDNTDEIGEVDSGNEPSTPATEDNSFYNLLDRIITHREKPHNSGEKDESFIYESVTSDGEYEVSPTIEVRLTIDFRDNDDLQDIADYLLYFDNTKDTNHVYFKYVIGADMNKLSESNDGKRIIDSYDQRLTALFNDMLEEKNKSQKKLAENRIHKVINEILNDCFSRILTEKVYYCNNDFTQAIMIPVEKFRKLFNIHVITARRDLDDTQGDHSNTLSSRLMKMVTTKTDNKTWNQVMSSLQIAILNAIDGKDYKEAIASEARDVMNSVITEIAQTNGGHAESVTLNGHITFDAVEKFLSNHTVAEFGDTSLALGEQSQGLGYSNLIYITIEFLDFLDSCKTSMRKINFLVIEEPESHMHPQMQSVFIRKVFEDITKNMYNTENGIYQHFAPTCLITTHSTQIVRESKLQQIRVARQERGKADWKSDGKYYSADSTIINLKERLLEHEDDETTVEMTSKRRMYEILFDLNFADIVFADKVILFEGDTERMYLQALIQGAGRRNDKSATIEFDKLRQQYIAYVQVGGRHAFQYIKLLKILGTRSVIITDIDYTKPPKASERDKIQSVKDIERSITGNSTLIHCLWSEGASENNKEDRTVNDVYSRIAPSDTTEHVLQLQNTNGTSIPIAIACQTQDDGYSRTLEEAMLCKLLGIDDVLISKNKKWWINKSKDSAYIDGQSNHQLFPIPRKQSIRVRDVVHSIGDKKN